MKSYFLKHDSPYIKDFMKNVQHLTDDVIEVRSKFYREFQQSDFDLSDDRKLLDWAAKQSYIPLANMMTSAAMLGIDSCPIEGFKQAETDTVLKQDFGVDTSQYSVSYMVAFGYRANEPKVKTRRSSKEVITWR
jgi:nitroreductase